jgi:hypothetical protein
MTKLIVPGSKTVDVEVLELGFALGQSHTFGLVAGRCSAAQAHGIRKLREEKLFKQCCEKWEDFCPNYLNMSRAEADRIVRLLDEFGPSYFELSQVIRISAETFRAIAPAVSDGVLNHKGEAIPINGENSRKVAAAVAEIRSALPKKSAKSSEPAQDLKQRIHGLAEHCVEMIAALDRVVCDQHLGLTRHLRDELVRLRDQILQVAA